MHSSDIESGSERVSEADSEEEVKKEAPATGSNSCKNSFNSLS